VRVFCVTRRLKAWNHASTVVSTELCGLVRSYGVVSMCVGTGMGAAAVIECPGRLSKL